MKGNSCKFSSVREGFFSGGKDLTGWERGATGPIRRGAFGFELISEKVRLVLCEEKEGVVGTTAITSVSSTVGRGENSDISTNSKQDSEKMGTYQRLMPLIPRR